MAAQTLRHLRPIFILRCGPAEDHALLVNAGGVRNSGAISPPNYLLLGVISGYYPEGEIFSVPATVLTGEVHDNSGIATVVPAYELKALLDSTPL